MAANNLSDLAQLAAERLDAGMGQALVMADPAGVWRESLRLMTWDRRKTGARTVSPEPPGQKFTAIALHVARDKAERTMLLHMALARLAAHGTLMLWGLKEEGIESYIAEAETLTGNKVNALSKHHGRIAVFSAPKNMALKPALADWTITTEVTFAGHTFKHHTYPGLFANGLLDAGTKLLCEKLPDTAGRQTVLDYGCGSGMIAALASHLRPDWSFTLCDHDSVALEACKTNVPDAPAVLADRISVMTGRTFDLILSNPPIHRGTVQDHGIVETLIADARDFLMPHGRLILVTQQTVPVARFAAASGWQRSSVMEERDGYRVWGLTQG